MGGAGTDHVRVRYYMLVAKLVLIAHAFNHIDVLRLLVWKLR